MYSQRRCKNNNRSAPSGSRKSSSTSVINDIDQLYHIKKLAPVRESLPTDVEKDANVGDNDDYFTGCCCRKLRKKRCWKPFKQTVIFIFHFLTVLGVLFCGAIVFSWIEDPAPDPAVPGGNPDNGNVLANYSDLLRNYSNSFWSSLQKNYNVEISEQNDREQFLEEVSLHLAKKRETVDAEKHQKEREDRFFIISKWIYFGTVACTTIGYGDVSPKTDDGRLFYIFFSIIGIPLMVTLLKSCGALITAINKKFFGVLNRCCFQGEPVVSEELLSATSIFILFLGYIAAGCLFNAALSQWPLFTSIYFWIVTFTTVGFGDVTHTFEDQKNFLFPLLVYRVFGLAMLAGVIDSILEYVDVRKVEIERKVREKKLRMSRKLSKKRNSKSDFRREKKKQTKSHGNKGAMTFDARVHESIFGDGETHYDSESYDGSSVDSAEEESEESS